MKLVITNRAIVQSEAIASKMRNAQAGVKFMKEAFATFERIALMPTIGSVIEELSGSAFAGKRRCTIKRFRGFVVIYSWTNETITIHQVFDGKRDYLDLFSEVDRIN
jgi:plasmid stabilization system protein ParE